MPAWLAVANPDRADSLALWVAHLSKEGLGLQVDSILDLWPWRSVFIAIVSEDFFLTEQEDFVTEKTILHGSNVFISRVFGGGIGSLLTDIVSQLSQFACN